MTHNLIAILLPLIICAVIGGIIIWKIFEKKRTIKEINVFCEKIQSCLGEFIEKWDEDKFISEADKIQEIITKRKYKFEEATRFSSVREELPKTIYSNNLKVLERNMTLSLELFNNTLGNGKEFVDSPSIKGFAETFRTKNKTNADKSIRYESLIIKEFMDIYNETEKYIHGLNTTYINNEKNECKHMFDDIDGRSLDENQRDAVVNDDLRQLVIAGAGSGKTLTMSAKVKYLVERKNINPKDILLISFTRKAAEEMGERIRRLGIDVDSATFHKFGLGVIRSVDRKTPDVAEDISKYLDSYLKDVIYNDDNLAKEFLVLLGTLMLPVSDSNETVGDRILAEQRQDLTTIKGMYEAYGNKVKSDKLESEISDLVVQLDPLKRKIEPLHEKLKKLSEQSLSGEIDDEEKKKDVESTQKEVDNIDKAILALETKISKLKKERTSIRNERMKSAEEVMLANMFFLDGVPYVYEDEYPYDEEENFRKKYRPDFHLTECDLYWEHFGINEDGKARQYSEVVERQYLEGIDWKRDLHKKYNTRLAETYSWQFRKNVIADAVESNYRNFGVQKHDVRYCDVIREILKGDSQGNIESFKSLMGTFISLFKSYGYDIEMFNRFREDVNEYSDDKLSPEALDRRKTRDGMFLDLAEKFYTYYGLKLNEEHKIDFNDMILQATSLIEHGEFTPSYKYVIIDEYQDISVGRYRLTRATLEKSGAKLFCVGDDWQSIYRFSGSEVDLFVNFEKYFGEFSRTFIDKTYRNSQQLLDISGAFVMQNDYQTPKILKSDKRETYPLRGCMYTGRYNPILEDEKVEVDVSMEEAFICAVDEIVKDFPEGKILVLGRNNGDIRELTEGKGIQVNKIDDETKLIVNKYPNLDISYLTVHRSKGLEADNVILINLKNSRSGFPNQIVDDPVLNLLRNTKETFLFAEERRLFYVAMTRTRNRTYMLVPMSKSSRFLDDLSELYREKVHGDISVLYPKKISDVIDLEIDPATIKPLGCPACRVGTLVKRRDPEGKIFVSCSNFPACNYSNNNLESVRKNNRCPVCNNFLTKRDGKYGEFFGCMSYPYCSYTVDIDTSIDLEENGTGYKDRLSQYLNKSTSTYSRWTIEDDRKLKEGYEKRMSITQISKMLNKPQGNIYYRLKKLGLME